MARKKSKPKRARRDKPKDPADELDEIERDMVAMTVQMAERLLCPVELAGAHSEIMFEQAAHKAGLRDVMRYALELYAAPDSAAGKVEIAPVLIECIEIMDRQARELAELAERFAKLTDHDVEHGHIDPASIDIGRVADAMYGKSDEEEA